MASREFWLSFGPLILVNGYAFAALAVFVFIAKKRPKTPEIEERRSSVILNKWAREFWMWITQPIFNFFIWIKITPNWISFLGTLAACFSAAAFAFGKMGLGGWLMVLGASLDFFDGRVARATNQESLAGTFLDSSLDRVSEGIVLSGIAYSFRHSFIFWLVMAAYLGSMLTSYTKSKGENMGVAYSGGMMQRPERIAYLGSGAIVAPMLSFFLFPMVVKFVPTVSYRQLESWLYAIPLVLVAFFSLLASLNRMTHIMGLLNDKEFGDQRASKSSNNYK